MKKMLFVVAALCAASLCAETRTIAAGETYSVNADNWDEFAAYATVTIEAKTDALAAGVLELNTANPPPATMAITGGGRLVKTSSDDWTLTTSITDFTGDYEIQAGHVTATDARQFGNVENGKVIVSDGATLTWSGAAPSAGRFGNRSISIVGKGVMVGGRNIGAFRITKLAGEYPINKINLTGDALYVQDASQAGYAFRSYGGIYLNGYTLTVNVRQGQPFYLMYTSIVADATKGGTYIFEDDNGTRRQTIIREDSLLPKLPGQTIMRGNTLLTLHNLNPVQTTPLTVDGEMQVQWTSNDSKRPGWGTTNCNNLAGPITFANADSRVLYTSTADYQQSNCVNIAGKFIGAGTLGLWRTSSGQFVSGRFAIHGSSSPDEFTGNVVVSNNLYAATMAAYRTNSLPNYAKVYVQNGTIAAGLMPEGAEHRWTPSTLAAFNDSVNWGASSHLTIDTTFLPQNKATFGGEEFAGLVKSDYLRLGYDNRVGELVLTGRFEKALSLGVFRGRLALGAGFDATLTNTVIASCGPAADTCVGVGELVLDGANVRTGVDGLYIGRDATFGYYNSAVGNESTAVRGRITVTNSTLCTTWYPSDNKKAKADMGALRVGWYRFPGVMTIESGAVISNYFLVGSGNSNMAAPHSDGGFGAVYQRGGDVTVIGTYNNYLSSSIGIGNNSYGYWGLSGGTLKLTSHFMMGGYGIGVMHVTGGELTTGANWLNHNGSFYIGGCNGGKGVFYVTNAICRISSLEVGTGDTANRGFLTVDAGGQILANSVGWGASNNKESKPSDNSRMFVTVCNGGLFEANTFRVDRANWLEDAMIVNADGGTIRATANNTQFFGRGSNAKGVNPETWVRIYKGGLTVDSNGKNIASTVPIKAAEGKGVKSIPWTAKDGYIGAPYVTITGDGYGAVAVADFDEETGTVKGIVVKSPGWGYTKATANVSQGNSSKANVSSIACTLEDNDTTGSLTKTGDGTFTLSATNTWGGATIVKGGTLKATCDWAVPTNSAVVLAGGDVDFGGYTGVVSKVTYGAGGGQLLNATNVEKPAADDFDMTITTDEILAGQPVKVPAGSNLAGKKLTITGDWSGLATENPTIRYPVVIPASGEVSGMPTIVASGLPAPWEFRVSGTGVRLVPRIGLSFIVR